MQRNDNETEVANLENDPTTTKLQRDRLNNKIEEIRLIEAAQKTSIVSSENAGRPESQEKQVDFALMANFTAEEKGHVTIDLKKTIIQRLLKTGQDLGLMSY